MREKTNADLMSFSNKPINRDSRLNKKRQCHLPIVKFRIDVIRWVCRCITFMAIDAYHSFKYR